MESVESCRLKGEENSKFKIDERLALELNLNWGVKVRICEYGNLKLNDANWKSLGEYGVAKYWSKINLIYSVYE